MNNAHTYELAFCRYAIHHASMELMMRTHDANVAFAGLSLRLPLASVNEPIAQIPAFLMLRELGWLSTFAALPILIAFIFCQNIILRGIVVPVEK